MITRERNYVITNTHTYSLARSIQIQLLSNSSFAIHSVLQHSCITIKFRIKSVPSHFRGLSKGLYTDDYQRARIHVYLFAGNVFNANEQHPVPRVQYLRIHDLPDINPRNSDNNQPFPLSRGEEEGYIYSAYIQEKLPPPLVPSSRRRRLRVIWP